MSGDRSLCPVTRSLCPVTRSLCPVTRSLCDGLYSGGWPPAPSYLAGRGSLGGSQQDPENKPKLGQCAQGGENHEKTKNRGDVFVGFLWSRKPTAHASGE